MDLQLKILKTTKTKKMEKKIICIMSRIEKLNRLFSRRKDRLYQMYSMLPSSCLAISSTAETTTTWLKSNKRKFKISKRNRPLSKPAQNWRSHPVKMARTLNLKTVWCTMTPILICRLLKSVQTEECWLSNLMGLLYIERRNFNSSWFRGTFKLLIKTLWEIS